MVAVIFVVFVVVVDIAVLLLLMLLFYLAVVAVVVLLLLLFLLLLLAKQVNSTNSGNYFQRMGNSLGNEKKTVSNQKQEAKTREKLDNFGNVKAAGRNTQHTPMCKSPPLL